MYNFNFLCKKRTSSIEILLHNVDFVRIDMITVLLHAMNCIVISNEIQNIRVFDV